MHSTTQQDQLEIVSTLATSLADRMLMERLTRGTLPLANADRLWTASRLLEAHQRPVPRIVADVLDQVRSGNPAGEREGSDAEIALVAAVSARRAAPAPRAGRLSRLLRPFLRPAEA
jgi:hypothetical protein